MNILLQILLLLGGIIITALFWIFVFAWAFTMNGYKLEEKDKEE